jgi:hypothetical protein
LFVVFQYKTREFSAENERINKSPPVWNRIKVRRLDKSCLLAV